MGKVIMSGIVPQLVKPITGIMASDLAVGSIVKLMENGSPVEYLVVHNGLPSSMYDASCDGLWLLRKDIYENRQWHSSNVNNYQESDSHSYLNSDFLNLFDIATQGAIRQVKIPYVNGTGGSAIASGANGLSTKIFFLCGYEVGWTTSNSQYFPTDGASLSYFNGANNSKRIAYLNGSANRWWLRSPYGDLTFGTTRAMDVYTDGDWRQNVCKNSGGIRPALILPHTAIFDEETLVLKGVS